MSGITPVQHNDAQQSIAGPLLLTLPGASTRGNFYGFWTNGNPPTSVTDNAVPPNTNNVIASLNDLNLYYAENINVPLTGPTTITIAYAGVVFMSAGVTEWSGVALTGALDQSISTSGSGSPLSSGNMSPTTAGQLILGAISTPGGYGYAPSGGFTTYNNLNNMEEGDQALIQATAAPIAITCTFSSGGVTWTVIGATFKAASGIIVPSVAFDSMNE